jgi:flagellar biosynthesis regulator FlaF
VTLVLAGALAAGGSLALEAAFYLWRRRQRRAIDDMRSHAEALLREARLSELALSAMVQRHKHPVRVHTN